MVPFRLMSVTSALYGAMRPFSSVTASSPEVARAVSKPPSPRASSTRLCTGSSSSTSMIRGASSTDCFPIYGGCLRSSGEFGSELCSKLNLEQHQSVSAVGGARSGSDCYMPVGPSARFAPRPFLRCFPGRKKPPLREQRRPALASARKLFLQRGVARVEVAAQLAAEAVHGRDNRQRDTGRDQPVLNGGGAGFI